ncbi:MAG TPA: DUF3795 domain-containing protein [Spirochaetota bacterium]|nr:DUF3795 domain-containing protein [Spirochaetota bacterium]HOD15169.1 DUF3795 domain-containing protein [Spirochaetota bacterium]HPN12803.1 DUF3795 domain-containing protein [Spirochaetota bacterium]HQL82570.1 DUF3795 domain-containing protein [Spirochaetota bacterium]
MENFNYDSYCGIYCGSCDILISYKTGIMRKLAIFWNESTVRKFQKITGAVQTNQPYAVQCHGCKSDQLFINCSSCKIRECAINKKVEHCFECAEYPCKYINNFQKGDVVLSHLKNNRANLEFIKKNGVQAWLADQEKKWQCPDCSTSFSWYTPKCENCGKDLKGKSKSFSLFKSSLMKLSIYLAPNKKKGKVNVRSNGSG